MTSARTFRLFQLASAAAMIGFAVSYGYESYQANQCLQAFNQLSESNRARLTSVQARIEDVRTREAHLQARSGELIGKFNGPQSNEGKKN
jgi:hypothetical protein